MNATTHKRIPTPLLLSFPGSCILLLIKMHFLLGASHLNGPEYFVRRQFHSWHSVCFFQCCLTLTRKDASAVKAGLYFCFVVFVAVSSDTHVSLCKSHNLAGRISTLYHGSYRATEVQTTMYVFTVLFIVCCCCSKLQHVRLMF